MPDIEIRQATDKDVVGIVYVQATSWIKSYVDKAHKIDESDIRSVDFGGKLSEWQHILRSPSYRVWVVAEGQNILAFLAVRKDQDYGEIYEQHTLPENRRKGMGGKLFAQAEAWLEEAPILLRIPTYSDSGTNFYKKIGFSVYEAGEVDFIRLPTGKQIPTVVMRRANKLEKPVKFRPQTEPAAEPTHTTLAPQRRLVGRTKLAKLSGIRPSTIKYYTEIGILPFQQQDKRLARRYQIKSALGALKQIKQWRDQGLSIAQIKQRLG